MKKMSLRTKAVMLIFFALMVFVAFSIVVSYVFYSDAVAMSGKADAISTRTQFFIIFTCAEILVALIIIVLALYLVEYHIIKPINSLSEVVSSMVYDDNTGKEKYNSEESKKKLKELNITTGDEIEELYHSLQKMQMDMNEYIIGMREESWESEHDNMTMLNNRMKFDKRKKDVYPFVESIYIACMDVINMKVVNDKLGVAAGDSIISKVGRELRRLACDTIHTYRLEEDHFLIVMCGYREEEAMAVLTKWNSRVGRLNRATDSFDCRLVWGGSYGENDFIVDDVYKRADAEMYCQKMIMKKELGEI